MKDTGERRWDNFEFCDTLSLSTTVGTVCLLTACYRLGYILYATYLQQAVSILNKSNFPVVCSHNTDLWLVQYDDNERCLSHEARCFLSKHGRLQKNYIAWSCVNIALLSFVISGFTKKYQSCIYLYFVITLLSSVLCVSDWSVNRFWASAVRLSVAYA